jgi:hypothetical protein
MHIVYTAKKVNTVCKPEMENDELFVTYRYL